ncbi:hypothetical protein XH80_15990 [Bradyrhizobium sp. CCBAU 45384]|nr:hypothetical protein [Bradyrhizobium sp. CCBAU 45384]
MAGPAFAVHTDLQIYPVPKNVKKFICEQNVANFERLLAETSDASLRRTLEGLLASNRRELALLAAETEGAEPSRLSRFGRPRIPRAVAGGFRPFAASLHAA